jgi:pyrroloquinoline quinone biosynthesis protein E
MRAPCRGCAKAPLDGGGCRCQAYALTGDAFATDPACALSHNHHLLDAAVREAVSPAPEFIYRQLRTAAQVRQQASL